MKGLRSASLCTLVGRDDEAKLVRVRAGSVQECRSVHFVPGCVIEPAGLAFARHAIAHDVLDVGACGAEIARDDARVAGLDDHTATAWGDQAGGGADAGAHASFQAGRRNVTSLPQGARTLLSGLTEYQCRMALRSRLPGIANATELGIELVFSHATSRAVHRALRDVPPTQIFKMASKTLVEVARGIRA